MSTGASSHSRTDCSTRQVTRATAAPLVVQNMHAHTHTTPTHSSDSALQTVKEWQQAQSLYTLLHRRLSLHSSDSLSLRQGLTLSIGRTTRSLPSWRPRRRQRELARPIVGPFRGASRCSPARELQGYTRIHVSASAQNAQASRYSPQYPDDA